MAGGNNNKSGYPRPNTSGIDINCAIVSTARLLPNPTTGLPYTSGDLLAVVKARGQAQHFTGKDLDGLKSDSECRLLCSTFSEYVPVYKSFPRMPASNILSKLPDLGTNKIITFATCYVSAPDFEHVVVGHWQKNYGLKGLTFLDYQLDSNGKSVTEEVMKAPITGVWWFEKGLCLG